MSDQPAKGRRGVLFIAQWGKESLETQFLRSVSDKSDGHRTCPMNQGGAETGVRQACPMPRISWPSDMSDGTGVAEVLESDRLVR